MNTNYLRELAEDLHSSTGYNPIAAALSLAADEIERIRSNAAALEDEKNTYMDYVGDALAQDDNETLWDAAQRVLSERDRLRAELASSASRVSELTSALTLAIDLVDHWGSYASEYFQQKHDLAGDLATLRATLREGGEQMEFECAPRWRDVADELPREAQEVLFARGEKTVFGAWIGGIFWHNNQKMAAAYWMPIPKAPVQRGSK